MKVCEYFDADQYNELTDKAEESDYWQSCLKFVDQHASDKVENLSDKQQSWLLKIVDDLT